MPDDPRLERLLEQFLSRERLSRRRFVGRAGSTGLALSMGGLLAACGSIEGTESQEAEGKPDTASVNHPKTQIADWTFSNWPLYIDKKVIKDFNKKFGGKCKYVEEINDNNEFYGKIRQQLESGQPIGRDIITPTDYLASRLVRLNYIEPLDKKNIPNRVNMTNNLQTINYDPERDYSMPWQPAPQLPGIGRGHHPVHQLRRERPGQRPHRHPVGQPPLRRDPRRPVMRHTVIIPRDDHQTAHSHRRVAT